MKPVWTLEQIVDQLTNWQARWNTDFVVPYAFYGVQPPAHLGQPPGYSSFSSGQRIALGRTAQLISDVANIGFAEVADNGLAGSKTNPRITFYNIDYANAPFWGAASKFVTDSETPPMGQLFGAEIVVNQYRAGVQGGWGIGDSNPRKLMHELLHAIGIDHPGAYNGDGNTYEANAEFHQDTIQYTVMSYWNASITGANHQAAGRMWFASTPLLYDVAALQALYGANMTTRTGDTVYGFNSNAGRAAFDLAANPHAVFTIWDAGGNDTLDLSGYATSSRVDLNQGAFTDAGGLTGNISIAYGAVIENAIGGSGADRITGNEAANRLAGGTGFDVLEGQSGGDLFVFAALPDSRTGGMRSDGKKFAPDWIVDFTPGEDRIDISGIDAIAGTAANDAFAWIGSDAFSGTAGELRYQLLGGGAHLFGDVDGDGIADFQIATGATILVPVDLIL